MVKQITVLGILLVVLVWSCGKKESTAPALQSAEVKVQMAMQGAATAHSYWDSVLVLVSAPDMQTAEYRFVQVSDAQVLLEGLSAGENRLFEVYVWGYGGVLLYTGIVNQSLQQSMNNSVQITLQAQAAQVHIEIPLGLGNPYGIAGGYAQMDSGTYADSLQIFSIKGVFSFTAIPLGEHSLQIVLVDSSGDSLFVFADEAWQVQAMGAEPYIVVLNSLLTHAGVVLTVPALANIQVGGAFLGTGKKQPSAWGDVLITELLVNPKVSGTDYEYIELYNTTMDSLLLDSCVIGKESTSATATTHFRIQESQAVVAPGQFFVTGRDSVPIAHYNYSSFALSNSGQSVVLVCGGVVIDSMAYSMDSTNAYPVLEGVSMQLDLAQYQNRLEGSNWCAGTRTTELLDIKIKGSPGYYHECE
jgi:hypothetical protein